MTPPKARGQGKRKSSVRTEATRARRSATKPLATLERALHLAISRYAHRPQVSGVDLGYKFEGGQMTDRMAVRIHVREKFGPSRLSAREILPHSLEGVPVDVIQTNSRNQALEPEASIQSRRRHQNVVQGGLSVAAADGPIGTLGALMFDTQLQAACVLSCQHVLFGGADPVPGAAVVQPARADHGADGDAFARLSAFDPGTDAAIATLDQDGAGMRPIDLAIFFSGVVLVGWREPQVGDVLEKSGRSTGLTRAIVDGIGFHEGLSSALHLVPLPGADDPTLGRPGDSGAVWYDAATGEAVGLHCKGPLAPNPLNEFAIATKIVKVMRNLGLDFIAMP